MKTNPFLYEVSELSVSVKTPKWWQLESQVMEACDTLETFWVYFCLLETEIVPWWWAFKSHYHWLVSAGMRTCSVFLQYAVIERNSQVPERQESWWLPKGSGEAETLQTLCLSSSAQAKPGAWAPWGDGSGSIQFSPCQLQAGKPPCWQPGCWGQPPIEFPSLENLLRKKKG